MKSIRHCILVFSLYIVSYITYGETIAQTRWWPGSSPYFRGDTKIRMAQQDKNWEELNLSIHKQASGDHAKSMAIRAYLYEYCGKAAQYLLNTEGIPVKGVGVYTKYINMQTQLYQYLQPTVTKVRVVLDDPTISFQTIVAHLQSTDPDILYFYRTLPERYNDVLMKHVVYDLQVALHRFYIANNFYPYSLDDLIIYNFLSSDREIPKDILYIANNIPPIISIVPRPIPWLYIAPISSYIIAYPLEHTANIQYYTRTIKDMIVKLHTYDFMYRTTIKKTPVQMIGHGVGWGIEVYK